MNKQNSIFFLFCLLGISMHAHAAYLRYSGKCQFVISRAKYAYCLEKESVFYDEEFKKLYSNLTPEQSLLVTEALATQLIEPDCDAIARKVGAGLEYHIVYRTCLIKVAKDKIACLKRFTTSPCCGMTRKLINVLKIPYSLVENLSVYVSDPS